MFIGQIKINLIMSDDIIESESWMEEIVIW